MASAEQMMQMIQQMQAQMQQMSQQQTTLQAQNQTLNQQIAELSSQNQNLRTSQIETLTNLPSILSQLKDSLDRNVRKDKTIVDVKGVGKPSTFTNEEEKFRAWSAKVIGFLCGALGKEWRKVGEWAVEKSTAISCEELVDVWGDEEGIDDVDDGNSQFYTLLEGLTDGESFDIVHNVTPGNRMEVWRRLHRRWDPSTGARKRNLLKAIINPGKCKFSELGSALEKWEDQCRRYEARKNDKGEREKLTEDIKMSALESLVPEDLEKHLLLNSSRLNTYQLMRDEIVSYVEVRHGMKIQEARIQQTTVNSNAMDVDALAKGRWSGKGGTEGKGSKGREGKGGKGGGKGNRGDQVKGGKGQTQKRFEGDCGNCGKWGHKAADCWSKVQTGGKGGKGQKGKGDGKGKGGKGSGKGANSLEQASSAAGQYTEDGVAAAGSLDFCNLDLSVFEPAETSAEWVKCNFDTGAAITAIPYQHAPSGGTSSEQTCKTTSGEFIADFGKVAFEWH